MKKTHLIICLVLLMQFVFTKVHAQTKENKTYRNSFVIHGNLTIEAKNFFIKSIEAADLEQFRLKTATLTLKFKNGFLLELMPAKDLYVKKIVKDININNYSDHVTTQNYKYPVFEILDSGLMTAEVQNISK